ncbi:hypothetical protein [Chryseobacterium sp. StRB126]|uniref:hypothetical protein n=1 Tax=Chryseobacterium sp. StRB126 TaxID=878220 RepID=UPI0005EE66D3|nr:hypothetical protein [Chryseobacterium sp. StRB126]
MGTSKDREQAIVFAFHRKVKATVKAVRPEDPNAVFEETKEGAYQRKNSAGNNKTLHGLVYYSFLGE